MLKQAPQCLAFPLLDGLPLADLDPVADQSVDGHISDPVIMAFRFGTSMHFGIRLLAASRRPFHLRPGNHVPLLRLLNGLVFVPAEGTIVGRTGFQFPFLSFRLVLRLTPNRKSQLERRIELTQHPQNQKNGQMLEENLTKHRDSIKLQVIGSAYCSTFRPISLFFSQKFPSSTIFNYPVYSVALPVLPTLDKVNVYRYNRIASGKRLP